jgi:hypothetical protein
LWVTAQHGAARKLVKATLAINHLYGIANCGRIDAFEQRE